MTLSDIQELYAASPRVAELTETLAIPVVRRLCLQGLVASSAPLFFAALAKKEAHVMLFIMQDDDEAGYFYHDLCQIMESTTSQATNTGESSVLFFPSSYRRGVKYGQKDAANEILRTQVITRLTAMRGQSTENLLYIVTHPAAMAELVVSKKLLDEHVLRLAVGQTTDLMQLGQKLRELGFQEVNYVYEPGQFAMRGSLLDIYSFSSEYPYRIDFFGDDIDSIRTFDVTDQLSRDRRTEINVVPELSQLVEDKQNALSFLPEDAIVVARDFKYVLDTIANIYEEGFTSQAFTERLEGADEVERERIMLEMKTELNLSTRHQSSELIERLRTIEIPLVQPSKEGTVRMKFSITPQPLFHKNFNLLRSALRDYLVMGYRIYILADSDKQQARLREIIDETGTDHERSPHHAQVGDIDFTPVARTLHEGFIDNESRLCFLTDHQIFDRFHKYSLRSDKARVGKMALTMKELQEMEPGDFLVHVDFGIGKFGGLVRVPSPGGGYQEVIRLYYQAGDIVDVSIHSLYKISKYRRADTDEPPRLSKLGTGAWERLKERTKKRIKDIARDLIKLYASRRSVKGFAFSGDDYMQQELEASFIYEDTPDQLKATNDVKHDMEQSKPMDRLVCGDVGFGKTEVAIRAAFKAACDSKQTAVLVPTTVLAFQHFQTFKQRLQNFPVRVEYLSRARSTKQAHQILADLKDGRIDIIVGTHKLLAKDVEWHDLGLLIIDEEQKFGVSTKEKLRKLKTNVDTLTMSATPIPRTLQFSLIGARDMSIIRTPPPNRHPIQTTLSVFDKDVIVEAINFEMSRNGQVFFVNNRISGLDELARMIKKYIPDCRVAIGHGQMPPEQLEQTLIDFVNYDYDVLLSTTIVENGIDISNANTIIINDAHHFGLSDLHQMRGRVGRSNRKAFCYLLAPPRHLLSVDARKRLEALETFSELGSGFNIAMQDLDIRGAGNLLGAEQSGFIEDLGYETYQKILSQAVTELKNDEFEELYGNKSNISADTTSPVDEINGDCSFVDDCSIDSDLQMYFPDTYVPSSSERMLLYRELDNLRDDAELAAYHDRLVDRFGQVPSEGEELMQVVALRRLGKQLGCEKITLRQGLMNMQFVSNDKSPFYRSQAFQSVINFAVANARRCALKETHSRRLLRISDINTVRRAVEVLRQISGNG